MAEPDLRERGVEPGASSLGQRTITAAQWQLASSAVRGVLQFGVTVLLARLLAPEAFGLVALAMIVVGFAEMVVDLGVGPAIVQRDELSGRHVRTAFTVSVLLGGLIAAALFLAAPLFAPLLASTEVVPVLRWQALLFAFVGIGATARALLERRLDFRGLFFTDLGSYGLGYAVVAVAMALSGWGVWSLVVGSLVRGAIASGALLVAARHSLRPLLARRELEDLLNFGVGVLLNRTVVYASFNGDNLVVGRWLGVAALGLYSRAFQLMQLPLYHLNSITWKVLFSAYSRLQSDRRRAAAAYLKGIQLTALLVAPIMAGMVVAGPHLVVGLYGEPWAAATLPLQILCAVGLLRAVYSATGALTHAFGEVYAEFRRQAVYAVLMAVGAVVGSRWGIEGVAVGVAGAVTFMYLAMAQLGVRIAGCRWRDFFAAQLPGVLLGATVAAAALAVRVWLEGQGMGSGVILLAIILACMAAVPVGLLLMPARIQPTELFRSLGSAVSRLPAVVRLPLQRVMHLASEPAQVAS